MKKHVLGLMLFGFIVGAAAFVYAMFNVSRVEEVPVPISPQTYSSKTSCWRTRRDSRAPNVDSNLIEQAVFDLKTKQFSWKLSDTRTDLPIALHFFISDGNETRYIYSEKYAANTVEGRLKFSSSRLSPADFDANENLYVIAEFMSPSERFDKNSQPEFNASRAMPVVIDYGK